MPENHVSLYFLLSLSNLLEETEKGDRSLGIHHEKIFPCTDPRIFVDPIDDIFVLRNVFTKNVCDELILISEDIGYESIEQMYSRDYRNNLRTVVVDAQFARYAFDLFIKNNVPEELEENGSSWTLWGLNSHFRFCKYEEGNFFKKQIDHCAEEFDRSDFDEVNKEDKENENDDDENIWNILQTRETLTETLPDRKSMFTVNLYLNENFEGGNTRFYEIPVENSIVHVRPETGLCLIFRQPTTKDYVHDGQVVSSGTKYLLRTDVFYERKKESYI